MSEKRESDSTVPAYENRRTQFMNETFYVDPRVYVPNAETELMVGYILQYIRKNGLSEGTLVDVGTGCGCNAITIAKQFPKATVIATDISADALSVAKHNAALHGVNNITFIETDLIAAVDVKPDLVFGNLPWGDDDHLLQTNTKEGLAQMPAVAVFAPDGIVGAYVRLANQILQKNWTTTLIAETGMLEQEILADHFSDAYTWERIQLDSAIFDYSVTVFRFEESKKGQLVHHHLIYQATVDRPDLNVESGDELIRFLKDMVNEIGVKILIPPQVAFSHQKAWTGIVGIITSHITFHYWTVENYLQLDVYSCKPYDVEGVVAYLNNFWNASGSKTIFLEREVNQDFLIRYI